MSDIFLTPNVVQYPKPLKLFVIGELSEEVHRIMVELANFQAELEKTYDPDGLRPAFFARFVEAVIVRYGPLPRDPLPVLKEAWGELGFNSLRPTLLEAVQQQTVIE